MEVKIFRPTMIESTAAAFISYLSRLNFKLLSWLLKHFGHIQFKNKDGKSAVSVVLKSKTVIGFSPAIWQLRHRKS